MKSSKPFIQVKRANVIETVHRASIVVFKNNRIIYNIGNPDLIVPLRSTAKPFMLLPLLRIAESNGILFSEEQIAIMVSSHNGEKIHRDVVSSILEMADLSVSDLNCGTHIPFYKWLYNDFFKCTDSMSQQLFHNCSGKHAGMLFLCKLLDVDIEKYWEPNHVIQSMITESVMQNLHITNNDYFSIAIDGCGVPTYCITLSKLAEAYQELGGSQALFKISNAMIKKPYFVAGKDRIDTIIAQDLGFIAKSGSDGLFCINCPKENIGIALKIEDGNDDAAESAIVEVLDNLSLIGRNSLEKLKSFWHLPILTSTGIISGYYEPIKSV